MAKARASASKKQTSAKKSGAAQKSAKKPAVKKKSAAKKVAGRAVKAPVLLTTEQRRKLLKPRDDFEELVEQIARTWNTARALRVPGLTAPRLLSMLKRARSAAQREQAVREKMERTLRPLYDARLLAENEVWRAVLDVNAAVKLYARNDPALGETFDFIAAALTSGPRGGGAEPEPPAAEQGTSTASGG